MGAHIHALTNDGDTPLHYAAASNDAAVFQYFKEKGVKVDHENVYVTITTVG